MAMETGPLRRNRSGGQLAVELRGTAITLGTVTQLSSARLHRVRRCPRCARSAALQHGAPVQDLSHRDPGAERPEDAQRQRSWQSHAPESWRGQGEASGAEVSLWAQERLRLRAFELHLERAVEATADALAKFIEWPQNQKRCVSLDIRPRGLRAAVARRLLRCRLRLLRVRGRVRTAGRSRAAPCALQAAATRSSGTS